MTRLRVQLGLGVGFGRGGDQILARGTRRRAVEIDIRVFVDEDALKAAIVREGVVADLGDGVSSSLQRSLAPISASRRSWISPEVKSLPFFSSCWSLQT